MKQTTAIWGVTERKTPLVETSGVMSFGLVPISTPVVVFPSGANSRFRDFRRHRVVAAR